MEDKDQVRKPMKKINLLYVLDNPASVHEYRYLKMISSDQDINLYVATCSPVEFIIDTRKLNLKIFKSPEHKICSSLPLLNGLLHSFRYYRFTAYLKKLINELKIDLVHSGWLSLSSYAVLKTGFHPVLAMSWGSDVLNNPCNETPHNSRRLLKRIKYVADNADIIYSDAEYVAETLTDLTGIDSRKIRVFPQIGVDMTLFRPDDLLRRKTRHELNVERAKVILSVRSFYPVYAVDTLIKALPGVLRSYPEVMLLLAGEGPMRQQLETLVDELKIKGNVKFVGNIPNHQLPGIYNAADLYLSVSLSDGTSMCLLEAMSCGLPVVVTDVPANMEWIKDGYNGWIAMRGDIQSITSKIIQALESEEAMRLVGKRNHELAIEKIDIVQNYKRLSSIYRELADGRSKSF